MADTKELEFYVRELESKAYELEHTIGVLWRWCLINSILLCVFTLLLALR